MTTQVQFGFTPVEHEVWALRFLGHTPEMIGDILNLERVTVDSHLQQCLSKCQQHIVGEIEVKRERVEAAVESEKEDPVQPRYFPVVVAPVPEFAAFYL